MKLSQIIFENDEKELALSFKAALDKEMEDGRIQFHFKTKFKPAIVDHNTKPIDNNVWGGSILRCNYKPAGYYVAGTGLGCTLRLTGVQVKKLVEGQLGTAGFTEVEPEVNQENY